MKNTYPENTIEHDVCQIYCNAARFHWDASTINLMILEYRAVNGIDFEQLREIRTRIQREFEKEHIVFTYDIPGKGRVAIGDDNYDAQEVHESGAGNTGQRRYADDYSKRFFPNKEQEERKELENRHFRASVGRQRILNSDGISVNARENKFHTALLANGWKLTGTTNHGDGACVHKYEHRNGKYVTVTLSGGCNVTTFRMHHTNGREHIEYGTRGIMQYLKQHSK